MKKLNDYICEYTKQLQSNNLQIAYRGIIDWMNVLRAHYEKGSLDMDVSGLYEGFMDMSYFSLSSPYLKERGLKIAIVYLHSKMCFEGWLSARNRQIGQIWKIRLQKVTLSLPLFHDSSNQDAIIEMTLVMKPNFDEEDVLMRQLDQNISHFIQIVESLIESLPDE
ncbi:MAG: hypothetical protein PHY42_03240 [Bacilli bacterium]|nr:hypothetical protein [Bacilli bacterium]